MISLQRLIALTCVSLLAACGGGGGDDTPAKPIANAGADQTVERGASVTLDGSGSSTTRSDATLTYTWTLVEKPVGSAAALDSATAQKPTFDTDLPGQYEADLIVSDGTLSSDHDRVIITATNPDPVAVVNQTAHNVLIGATVSLDASGSLPPTGKDPSALVYEWTLTEKPAGSSAALTGSGGAVETLYTEVTGTYTATLVVRYGDKVTEPVTVTITASNANTKPVANPGGPYTIERGQTLTLDGSGSSDADGDTLSYRWYIFGPTEASGVASVWNRNGSALTVENAIVDYDKQKAKITPDAVGSWIVYLVVHDGTSISDFKSANITVTKPEGAANTPPVAHGWGTSRLSFIEPSYITEAELSVAVFGSGNSWDLDGDALTRRFRWISTPAGYEQADLSTATSMSFTPTVAGDYSFELIVNDGKVDSAPLQRTYTARTGANRAPSAAVTVDSQTILAGSEAWFDGTTSTDPDLDALTYHWKLIDKPDGSTAVLEPRNATRADGTVLTDARAVVKTDKPGIYLAALVVKDNHGVSGPLNTLRYGRVLVKGINNIPSIGSISNTQAANRGNTHFNNSDQPYVIGGDSVTLYMRDPVDPDLDTLYALWTLQQPTGSTLPDAYSTTLTANLGTRQFPVGKPVVAGRYTATAVVSDGVASSAPQTLAFNAVDRASYPSLLLEDKYSAGPLNRWDESVTTGFSGPGEGSQPRQRAFPYAEHEISSFPVFWGNVQAGDNVVKNYRLTAFGGDYTITNLQVGTSTRLAEYPGFSGKFSGLTEGQVIKNGETVDFSLIVTAPGPGQSRTSNGNIVDGVTFTFGVAQKPGWSFEYLPYLY